MHFARKGGKCTNFYVMYHHCVVMAEWVIISAQFHDFGQQLTLEK